MILIYTVRFAERMYVLHVFQRKLLESGLTSLDALASECRQ